MIVTFRPTINTAADYTACYLNFLRCVTAVATAPAGTTSLTVNPLTATGTIDTTKNCIVSIDANTEAGGWTTSASHNVPGSLVNTAQTYTALASAGGLTYRADFYNSSGKPSQPFKKLCFHSYTTSTATTSFYTAGSQMALSSVSSGVGTNMLITFGSSSTSDWTSNTFPPAGGVAAGQINVPATQTTSFTLNNLGNTGNNGITGGFGLMYTDTSVEYHIAITADYCIIWESKVGDTYAAGYFNTTTTHGGTSWNRARFGSIFYAGLRETQPWENAQPNNVPWVCWQNTLNDTGLGSPANPYAPNLVAASMLRVSNTGVNTTTPVTLVTNNAYNMGYFWGGGGANRGQNSSRDAYNASYNSTAGAALDGPIFITRSMGGSTSDATNNGQLLAGSNNVYLPQYDTVTGLFVPGAYPIKISTSRNDAWNPGGACRGIYKSLSMPYTNMKQYWQSADQTFTIGTDTYIPFVINNDMWLVRKA
jgi:hypothetical protein